MFKLFADCVLPVGKVLVVLSGNNRPTLQLTLVTSLLQNKVFTNRIPPMVWNVGDDLQFHHSGFVVIGVPSTIYHGLLEDILSQVRFSEKEQVLLLCFIC